MRAYRIHRTGGPEVLALEEVPTPAPGPGEILIRHQAIGVNYIDIYHRTGLYPLPLPIGLGLEAAGIVEAVGEGVSRFKPGDRVGYCTGPIGAYSQAHCVPAERAILLPAEMSFDLAAACLVKGITARYLLRMSFHVKPGDWVLAYAAAGGVGQILTQWAAHLGAHVIGVTSSPAKANIARANGCEYVILFPGEDIAARVREITMGAGVAVAYDSVGKDTFQATIASLAPLGMFVSFGNASGPVAPFDPQVLAMNGSLFFTRPTLVHYTRTPEMLQECADDLFAVMGSGAVGVAMPQRFPFDAAADAHRALESRATTGSLILAP